MSTCDNGGKPGPKPILISPLTNLFLIISPRLVVICNWNIDTKYFASIWGECVEFKCTSLVKCKDHWCEKQKTKPNKLDFLKAHTSALPLLLSDFPTIERCCQRTIGNAEWGIFQLNRHSCPDKDFWAHSSCPYVHVTQLALPTLSRLLGHFTIFLKP